MEACASSHHWGRWFAARGHVTRLIPAEFVKPFRPGGKNDTADAEATAVAARQPTMRFVAIKSVDQQAILAWHSVRQGWQEERTSLRLAQNLVDVAQFKFSLLQLFMAFRTAALSSIRRHRFRFS
jgi:transposase